MKKFIAIASAMAMAMCPTVVSAGTTVTASPATGGAASAGEIEDIIDKEVFVAILPTAGSTDSTFDFTLDPQDLLKDTSGSAVGGADFYDNTGMYFENADGSYSSSSDAVVLETKTSTDCSVKVDIEVTLTSAEGVTFATDASACKGTEKNIYLAVEASNAAIVAEAGTATKVAVGTDGKVSVQSTNAALPASSFEVQYSGSGYSYGLTSDAQTAAGSKFEFKLLGACNKEADWKAVKDMAADVDVVWTITKGGSAAGDTYKLTKNADGSTSYTFVTAPTGSLTALTVNGISKATALTKGLVTYSDGKLTCNSTFTSNQLKTNSTVVVTIGGTDYTLTYTP